MQKLKCILSLFCLLGTSVLLVAQENNSLPTTGSTGLLRRDPFKQLEEELPTPTTYRTASGAPGHQYWQQRADYKMDLVLDDDKQRLHGVETITYFNNSPDVLTYLWLQLDQNLFKKGSDTQLTQTGSMSDDKVNFGDLARMFSDYDGGFKIENVTTTDNKDLPHIINKTMMRIDLPEAMKPGSKYSFTIKWWYNINDRDKVGGRSGYEYFPDDKNYLYTIAQFFPRMCVYNEVNGWQHKQFLGSGEFTLPFGNYEVNLTVPADHIVGASGELQNAAQILSAEQQSRWKKAQETTDKPIIIVTQAEAESAEKQHVSANKTWTFKAENVRDFAFCSSRKFIWDAMAVNIGKKKSMAMSYYPKEGNPLWEQYSTRVVAHTIRTYSKYTIDYPYPVAISVHSKNIGMEYPMICFNGGRPDADGTYSEGVKYAMIGVITHEVGHNFFPMIINSDERQWTWMDEGLNTFVQFLTEQEFEKNYPSRRGHAWKIVNYMKGAKNTMVPIMTNSESLLQFGNNAYGKPATALNILRETILGRELFDYAFKEYCRRWAFKHPSPADLFRTMEDASGVDLDWFWWGWFYTIDNVEVEMTDVKWLQPSTGNPAIEKELQAKKDKSSREEQYNAAYQARQPQTLMERDPAIKDFYTMYDKYAVEKQDEDAYQKYLTSLSPEEKKFLDAGYNFYEITFKNKGGLVMPIILEFEFTDGTKETKRIPAEVWRYNCEQFTKVFPFQKEVKSIVLDPNLETADVDVSNNYYPPRPQPSRFQLYKEDKAATRWDSGGDNPMKRAKKK